jgi:hypothetical protein
VGGVVVVVEVVVTGGSGIVVVGTTSTLLGVEGVVGGSGVRGALVVHPAPTSITNKANPSIFFI